MSIELVLFLVILAIFFFSVALNINMGLLALVGAFLTGVYGAEMTPAEVLAGFPGNMFMMLFGIVFLLGIAQDNGTMDWMVKQFLKIARGHIVLLPWIFFIVSALTSTLGPGVAPLLITLGLGMALSYGINPLLAGAMVVHGAQAGAFSPVAPFGVLINQLLVDMNLSVPPLALYLTVFLSHLVLAVVIFFVFGGWRLVGKKAHDDATTAAVSPPPLTLSQWITLLGFVVLLVGVVVFHVHIGVMALAIAIVVLTTFDRSARQKTLSKVPWGVILTICGLLTYVGVMSHSGAVNWLAEHMTAVGSPMLIALLMCYLVAVITAFASTFGTIGLIIPLVAPFIASGDVSTLGMISAMVISAVVTDISPFSTYGALVLAAAREQDREQFMITMLKYVGVLILVAPLLAWLVLIVPGWL